MKPEVLGDYQPQYQSNLEIIMDRIAARREKFISRKTCYSPDGYLRLVFSLGSKPASISIEMRPVLTETDGRVEERPRLMRIEYFNSAQHREDWIRFSINWSLDNRSILTDHGKAKIDITKSTNEIQKTFRDLRREIEKTCALEDLYRAVSI
jgi:hypothetical protein